MLWSFQPSLERVKGAFCQNTAKALPEYSVKAGSRIFASLSKGFTLIELLVVIALLGVVSLAAVLSFDNVEADTLKQINKSEMVEIRKALRQFKVDVGAYPVQAHPADFSQLTSRALPSGLSAWSPDTARGWRGPYLTSDGNGLVTAGTDLLVDGTGSILTGSPPTETVEVAGVADSFPHAPTADGLLRWRACTDGANPACEPHANWGRPYLLFDLDIDDARLVSMGPDGVYAGLNPSDPCIPVQDDIVMCLK
jgi:prepilin-type N-terminal cleavage/methylation domain-containing protein